GDRYVGVRHNECVRAILTAVRSGGEEIIAVAGERVLKCDRRASEEDLSAALLRDSSDVVPNCARIVGRRRECPTHGYRFRSRLEKREARPEGGRRDHERCERNEEPESAAHRTS